MSINNNYNKVKKVLISWTFIQGQQWIQLFEFQQIFLQIKTLTKPHFNKYISIGIK